MLHEEFVTSKQQYVHANTDEHYRVTTTYCMRRELSIIIFKTDYTTFSWGTCICSLKQIITVFKNITYCYHVKDSIKCCIINIMQLAVNALGYKMQ